VSNDYINLSWYYRLLCWPIHCFAFRGINSNY